LLGVLCAAKSTDMTKVWPAGKRSNRSASWAIPTNGFRARWICLEIFGESSSLAAGKEADRNRRAVLGGPRESERA
jgi:hypothetical protein